MKGFYRFYDDNWGVIAHAVEGQLLQRLHPYLYVRGSYRFYTQTAVDFFTTRSSGLESLFTADSDLGRFNSHTVGFKVTAELPFVFAGQGYVMTAQTVAPLRNPRPEHLAQGSGLIPVGAGGEPAPSFG